MILLFKIPNISCLPDLSSDTLRGVDGAAVRFVNADDGGTAKKGLLGSTFPVVLVDRRAGRGVARLLPSVLVDGLPVCKRLAGLLSSSSPFRWSTGEDDLCRLRGDEGMLSLPSSNVVVGGCPFRRGCKGDEVGGGRGIEEEGAAALGGRVCLSIASGVFSFTIWPMSL